jgi:Fe-S cluster assembly iron-binding protein IscA
MLTISENAVTVVKDLADRMTGSIDGGLRIATDASDASNFDVTMIPTPEAGDHVVENNGAHVFLEQKASDVLADKELDAAVDDEGAVRFSILSRV